MGEAGGGGVLAGLLAPLRLPERAVVAMTKAVEALGPMRDDLARVRRQTAPLEELPEAIEGLRRDLVTRIDELQASVASLEGDESHLNRSVRDLGKEVIGMHETLRGLHNDIQGVTERLPDPDAPGPLGKARDLITGGD